MSATTFVATTAEGNTVARTSTTKDYNFVILAKNSTNGNTSEHDDVENAWGWSGDKINADKAAAQAAKVYAVVRVVPVESKLTGKEARLVLDAIKAAPVKGSGSIYVGANTNTMGKVAQARWALSAGGVTLDPAKPAKATKAAKITADLVNAGTLAPAKAAKPAKAAPAKAEKPAKAEADLSHLEDAVTLVRNLEAQLADAVAARNAAMAKAYATGDVSYAKIAAVVGVSPMAARAQVARAN